MKKIIKKESIKFLMLCCVGFVLIMIVVLSGAQLKVMELLILGMTPYIVYQLYCAYKQARRPKKK